MAFQTSAPVPPVQRSPARHTAPSPQPRHASGRQRKPQPFAQRHPHLAFFLQHLVWAVRLVLAVVAIAPLFLFMVWFNYTVDCSGLFHGDVYTREIAAMLLDGQNVLGYESMDERSLSRLVVEQMETVPQTVALGSSRVMQMTRAVAGTEDFFNFGMTGGDFYDLLGTWYLFEQKGQLPAEVILCIDPWLFNGSGAADTERSDRNLYAQMLAECLGEPAEFVSEDKHALWEALISPSYFQGNVRYYRVDRQTQKRPRAVPAGYEDAASEVKNCDGSVGYTLSMHQQTPQQTEAYALEMASTFAWCDAYDEPDPERLRLFRKFLSYLQQKEVQVYFLLPPLHPTMYEYALTYPEDHLGFLRSEGVIRQLAAEYGIPVYGSYNPHILTGVDASTDFYDGVHCTSECLQKFWPGIETARAELAAGVDPSTRLQLPLDDDLYAQLQLRCGPEVAEAMRAELPLHPSQTAE